MSAACPSCGRCVMTHTLQLLTALPAFWWAGTSGARMRRWVMRHV